jgi:hypothetical protein
LTICGEVSLQAAQQIKDIRLSTTDDSLQIVETTLAAAARQEHTFVPNLIRFRDIVTRLDGDPGSFLGAHVIRSPERLLYQPAPILAEER